MSRREQLLGLGDSLPLALGPKVVEWRDLYKRPGELKVVAVRLSDNALVTEHDGRMRAYIDTKPSAENNAMLLRDRPRALSSHVSWPTVTIAAPVPFDPVDVKNARSLANTTRFVDELEQAVCGLPSAPKKKVKAAPILLDGPKPKAVTLDNILAPPVSPGDD